MSSRPNIVAERSRGGRVRPVVLLRDPLYRRFWIAYALAQLGTWMQTTALAWLTLQVSGSAAVVGATVAMQLAPSLLFTLPAGAFADRVAKKRLMLLIQVAQFSSSAVMAWAAWHGVDYWAVLAFTIVYGSLNAISQPVRQAYAAELAGEHMVAAVSPLNSMTFNTARMVGPAIAGLLLGVVSAAAVFAATVALLAPLLVVLLLPGPAEPAPHPGRQGHVLATMLSALRRVTTDRVLLDTLLLIVAASALVNLNALVPLYASDVLHWKAEGLGLLLSGVGVGALAAALLNVWVHTADALGRALLSAAVLGLGCLGLAVPLPGAGPVLTVAPVLVMGLVGAGMSSLLVNCNASTQARAPREVRGSIIALNILATFGSAPFGAALGGVVFEAIGGRATMALAGLLVLACALILAVRHRAHKVQTA